MELQVRAGYRSQLTKIVNEVTEYFQSPKYNITANTEDLDSIEEDLSIFLQRLNAANENLRAANRDVQCSKLEDKNPEKVAEYDDVATTSLARLQVRLTKVRNLLNPPGPTMNHNECNAPAPPKPSSLKLPKLELKKFSGHFQDWISFWENFRTAVHENKSLTGAEKFNYLQSVLTGNAAKTISGFTPTDACYDGAISLLLEEYGDKERLIDRIMQQLMSLPAVQQRTDVVGLRQLYNTVISCSRSLTALGVPSSNYSIMLKTILLKSMPAEIRIDYHRIIKSPDEVKIEDVSSITTEESSTLGEGGKQVAGILRFLKREVESIERASVGKMQKSSTKSMPSTAAGLFTPTIAAQCFFCKTNEHPTTECNSGLSLSEKKLMLKNEGRCFRCTQHGHTAKFCRVKQLLCQRCKRKHATTVCDPSVVTRLKQTEKKFSYKSQKNDETNCENVRDKVLSLCLPNNCQERFINVFLQTARVFLSAPVKTDQLFVRIIIDNGSQRTFIHKAVAEKLKLPIIGVVNLNVIPFGKSELSDSKELAVVKLVLMSQHTDHKVEIEAVVVPEICIDVLAVPDTNKLPLRGLHLADSNVKGVQQEEGLGLLLGADYYWTVVRGGHRKITDRLTAVKTIFGWTISGPHPVIEEFSSNPTNVSSLCSLAVLENMWNLELLGIRADTVEAQLLTKDMQEKYIVKTDTRYQAALPWKTSNSSIEDNHENAVTRLRSLMRRLAREPQRLFDYDKVMRDFISSGFAEPVLENVGVKKYYMPHKPVYSPEKSTTKIRIVFDASSHVEGAASLNECLWPGSNLLPEILKILLHFRIGNIGVAADIEKAFLQIALAPEDRDYHRFIWYSDKVRSISVLPPLQDFRMTRVTFGVTSSPFLLCATIQKHLCEQAKDYPETCARLLSSFYMDDLVLSLHNSKELPGFYQEATEIMGRAHMNLRKWISNDENIVKISRIDKIEPVQTILGLKWNIHTDELAIKIKPHELKNLSYPTKRNVLKLIAQIYDPLGFLGPIIIKLKILFQTIWRFNLEWDEQLTMDLTKEWRACTNDLEEIEKLWFPRWTGITENSKNEVHLFADASSKAFGAVAFVRSSTPTNEVKVGFLCAKARVAPLKRSNADELSLPKLELTAALIAARLAAYFKNTKLPFTTFYFWTDSQITLHWIRGEAKKWKPYVSSRVMEIQKLTNINDWRYCPGKDNPADLVTRGISIKQFSSSTLWKHGPNWLKGNKRDWPIENQMAKATILSLATLSSEVINASIMKPKPLLPYESCSSWRRLLRITAYVFRALQRFRKKDLPAKFLVTTELDLAEKFWIKYSQNTNFNSEITALKHGRQLPPCSSILTFNPFLDEDGILRMRSGLQLLNESTDIINPIILPKSCHLSKLLVVDLHERVLHGGVNAVLARLRERFWLLKGRQLIKTTIRDCRVCRKLKGKPLAQPFAPLPMERLIASKPFQTVGVDFAGPLFTHDEGEPRKVYIMIFTCAVVRAIHLELVPNLTTESCLLALRRFIARRGAPQTIYSDNARSFKRAATDIKEMPNIINSENFNGFLSNQRIVWRFIVERAPWWGGFWERLVRSVKDILKVTIWKAKLCFEELHTFLTEAERVINLRPLTYISDNPLDLRPLTPECFLMGTFHAATDFNETNKVGSTDKDLRANWVSRVRYTSHLWKRWRIEYLRLLRSAHHTPRAFSTEVKPGDVVLMYDPAKPRLHWKLALVETCYTGRDERVRACELRFSDGKKMRRPIQLLYPLEVNASGGPEDVEN